MLCMVKDVLLGETKMTRRGSILCSAIAVLAALGLASEAEAQSSPESKFCESVKEELDKTARRLSKDEIEFLALIKTQEEFIEDHRQLIRDAERNTRSRESLYRDYTEFLWTHFKKASTLRASIAALSESAGLLSDQYDQHCRFAVSRNLPTQSSAPTTARAVDVDDEEEEEDSPVVRKAPKEEAVQIAKPAVPVKDVSQPAQPTAQAVEKAEALASAIDAAEKPKLPRTGEECCSTANSHSSCWMNVQVTLRRSVTEGGPIRVIEAKETYWVGGDDIFIGSDVHKSKYSLAAKSEWPYGGTQTAGFTSIGKPPCNGDDLEKKIDIKKMSCQKPSNADQTTWVNWREIVANCDQ